MLHTARQLEQSQGDLLQALSQTVTAFGYQVQCQHVSHRTHVVRLSASLCLSSACATTPLGFQCTSVLSLRCWQPRAGELLATDVGQHKQHIHPEQQAAAVSTPATAAHHLHCHLSGECRSYLAALALVSSTSFARKGLIQLLRHVCCCAVCRPQRGATDSGGAECFGAGREQGARLDIWPFDAGGPGSATESATPHANPSLSAQQQQQ